MDNKKQNETTKENQPEKCVRSEAHHSRTPLSGTLQFQRLETHRAADHQAFRATCWPQFILRDGHLGKRNAQSLWLPAIPATPAVWVFVASAIGGSITQTKKVRKIYIMNHDGFKKKYELINILNIC